MAADDTQSHMAEHIHSGRKVQIRKGREKGKDICMAASMITHAVHREQCTAVNVLLQLDFYHGLRREDGGEWINGAALHPAAFLFKSI